MNLVSIIIPVYDVEDYISECLDSILNQSYKNFEIILVDDGSTDKSPQICDEYAVKNKNIRVIHQNNSGISVARNIGMKKAQGQWWMFIDSDDVIHPQMLEMLFKIINQNKDCKIACCNSKRIYKKNQISFKFYDNNNNVKKLSLNDYMDNEYWMTVWGKLYNKSVFNDITFPINRLHEDEFFTYKLLYQVNELYFTDNVLYFYRYRNSSMTSSSTYKDLQDFYDAFEERLYYFKQKNDPLLIKRVILKLNYLYLTLYNKANRKLNTENLKKSISKSIKEQDLSEFKIIELLKLKAILLFPNICAFLLNIKTKLKSGFRK